MFSMTFCRIMRKQEAKAANKRQHIMNYAMHSH